MPSTFTCAKPTDRRWQFYIGNQCVRIAERQGVLVGWSPMLSAQWPEVFFAGASAHHIITQWAPLRGWRCTALSPANALSFRSNAKRRLATNTQRFAKAPGINNNCSQGVDTATNLCHNSRNRGVDPMPVQPTAASAAYSYQRLDYTLSRYMEIHTRAEGIIGSLEPTARDTLSKLLLADMVTVFGLTHITEFISNPASRLRALVVPATTPPPAVLPPASPVVGGRVASASSSCGNATQLTHTQHLMQGVR